MHLSWHAYSQLQGQLHLLKNKMVKHAHVDANGVGTLWLSMIKICIDLHRCRFCHVSKTCELPFAVLIMSPALPPPPPTPPCFCFPPLPSSVQAFVGASLCHATFAMTVHCYDFGAARMYQIAQSAQAGSQCSFLSCAHRMQCQHTCCSACRSAIVMNQTKILSSDDTGRHGPKGSFSVVVWMFPGVMSSVTAISVTCSNAVQVEEAKRKRDGQSWSAEDQAEFKKKISSRLAASSPPLQMPKHLY